MGLKGTNITSSLWLAQRGGIEKTVGCFYCPECLFPFSYWSKKRYRDVGLTLAPKDSVELLTPFLFDLTDASL